MPIVPIRPGEGNAQAQSSVQVPPPDSYLLMAAAQMHSEGRLVQNAPPIDESQNYGVVGHAMGYKDPPIHAVDDKSYPGEADVKTGRAVDQTYGDKVAPFMQAGSKLKSTSPDDIDAKGKAAIFAAKAAPSNLAQRDQILNNWQAAQKSPVAALGFDPRVTVHTDLKPGDKGYNLGGLYTPGKDTLWYSTDHEDSVVHESMHRGIEQLRKSGNLPDEVKEYIKTHDNAEEYLVRGMMVKHLGDKELGAGKLNDEQVNDAKSRMQDSGVAGQRFRNATDALEAAASKYIASKHPGGPR